MQAARLENPWTFVRDWVAPSPIRMKANPHFRGRGVGIAFLDAGFHYHPDLLFPRNRIAAYVDVTSDREPLKDQDAMLWNWHGTMTSVVACGSGYLSQGLYRGLADQSQAILVKVSKQAAILRRDVARGLRWVLENQERYNIRVVNISLGVEQADLPSHLSLVDHWVEKVVDAGMTVVVAAGNNGGPVSSPAKSPRAITVGGYYDHLGELYNSNHGTTPDGIHKPDLLAPAALVASPILLNTPQQARAEALVRLLNEADAPLADLVEPAELDPSANSLSESDLRSEIEGRVAGFKVISPYYEHADGTSVAAPLVSSVIAQMLEARPTLSPEEIRRILVLTAERLPNAPSFYQGHGVVQAAKAVELAANLEDGLRDQVRLGPLQDGEKLTFSLHLNGASQVQLAGDFNDWTPQELAANLDGVWRAELSDLEPGKYRYKVLVDGKHWQDDPWNARKEPDNMGGMHSIVEVKL